MEGAEAGMIYNSVTGELYNGVEGINVIPCFYKLEYLEWKDRGEGLGAPIAIYPSSSASCLKQKQMQTIKIDYLMVITSKELHHIL